MMKPIRFAVIGAGAIARAYEPAFAIDGERRHRRRLRHDLEAAEAFARRVRVPGVLRSATLVGAGGLRCRHRLHAAGLARGDHLRAAPPAANTCSARSRSRSRSRSAKRMLATARDARVILTMASKFRYVADVRKAREIVESGAIGELIFGRTAFTSHVDMRHAGTANSAISGGGVLIDNGTHAVDILRYFLGQSARHPGRRGAPHAGARGRGHRASFRAQRRGRHGLLGSFVEHQQRARDVPAHLRQRRHDPRRLEGIEVIAATAKTIGASSAAVTTKYKRSAISSTTSAPPCGRRRARRHAARRVGVGRSDSGGVRRARPAPAGSAIGSQMRGTRNRFPISPRSEGGGVVRMAVHPTAIIEPGVKIGRKRDIWDHVHVRHSTQHRQRSASSVRRPTSRMTWRSATASRSTRSSTSAPASRSSKA